MSRIPGSNEYVIARARMVREQLVFRDINDEKVLAAMQTVPRHLFVDEALHHQAYGDHPLPIGEGQTISQPYIVALMTQMLQLTGTEKVLEIGTGCGYQTAILSSLCERIYTVERIKKLLARARRTFDIVHCFNIISKVADGTLGWPQEGPFDAIIVTAGGPCVPEALISQLADPGRLMIPVGDREKQTLVLVTREEGEVRQEEMETVRFVSLIGSQGW